MINIILKLKNIQYNISLILVIKMGNFLERFDIQMEKSTFSFLLVFFIIFLGVDVVSIIMIQIQGILIVVWYLVPLIIILVIAGLLIDKRRRAIFLLLLIPEGFLTLVLGFVTDPFGLAILWVFIGVFSGFTIVAILGYFADTTSSDQRGSIAGLVCGITWIIAAVLLSWLTSTISAPNILMFVFAGIKLTGGGISIYILIRKMDIPNESTVDHSNSGGFGGLLKESYGFLWEDSTFRSYLIIFILIWLAQGILLPFGGIAQSSPQPYQSMASIGFFAGGFSLIIGSYMLDKSRKQMIVLGSILALLSVLAYYFPIGSVCLAGISVLITTAIIILADIAPVDRRARFYSVFLLCNFVAFLAGFFIGYIIAGIYTFTPTVRNDLIVIVCAIITGFAVLFSIIWGKDSKSSDTDYKESSFSTATIPSRPISEKSPFDSSMDDDSL